MSLSKGVEIHPLISAKAGTIEFYTPQASHETMLVQIPPQTIDDMYVHKYQTDKLMVVRGEFILVILHNGKYQYIPLSDREPKVVTIPPLVPHSAINIGDEPCMLINAVIRHAQAHPHDYRPLKAPFPYDLTQATQLLASQGYSIAA
ncbi:dTDP-4-dehydrorhamnose 3,5-epimerase [Chamaesiphon sp.]|uniref:dTDP-4-dehydrorhamnose 3,5-epimerase n=1 Tax=Chamaesiphon sp. TaxID=2814140 RepID=UPI0035934CDC